MLDKNDHPSKLKFKDSQRVRILNALHFANINSIGELTSKSPCEIINLKKFGRVLLGSIETALFAEGFSLRRDRRCRICPKVSSAKSRSLKKQLSVARREAASPPPSPPPEP
jgi:hypothetical protein